jgi:hypothetical protein
MLISVSFFFVEFHLRKKRNVFRSVCVVHDVSNHWLRFKLDEEILKCLYAHPEKEAILILNKVKLTNDFRLIDEEKQNSKI